MSVCIATSRFKLLHDDYTMPGMRERFLQEARAASALNHSNICTVFDIGEQDHNPYLVMELLEGKTVKDRVAHGALSSEEIVRYGIEISDAPDGGACQRHCASGHQAG